MQRLNKRILSINIHLVKWAVVVIFITAVFDSISQTLIQPIQREYNLNLDRKLNQAKEIQHTFSQPYVWNPNVDSLEKYDVGRWERKTRTSWGGRKLKNESFIVVDTGLFYMTLDPLFNFQLGKDLSDTANPDISTNTRGFIVQGAIGKRFSFSSSFYENQSFFPKYLSDHITSSEVVPGQGRYKSFQTGGFDYAMSNGLIAFRPWDFLTIQGGHGKNFYGNGYRSLLLSDNSFNYPHLKITANLFENKVQYQTMHASLIELTRLPATTSSESQFIRKAGTFHSLGYSPISQLEISVFEGVIYQNWDSLGTVPLPGSFYVPVIFLNTALNGLESNGTNSVLGMSIRVNPIRNIKLYGQLAYDGFQNITSVSYQAGLHVFDVFGLKDLHFQTEYNQIDRYLYMHSNSDLAYEHYNGYLGHPSGNDLSELISL